MYPLKILIARPQNPSKNTSPTKNPNPHAVTSRSFNMKDRFSSDPPRVIGGIEFGALSPQEILKLSEVEVATRDLYDLQKGRAPMEYGALDPRMGVSNNMSKCKTCAEPLATCPGHFGHVKLALPCFHIGYFKATISILQNVCKDCARILLTDEDRRKFLTELRRPGIDNLRRMQILKKVNDQCKKQRRCVHCNSLNGVVKKAGPLKIIHDKFRHVGKKIPEEKTEFDNSFNTAKESIPEVERLQKKAMDDLNPLKVFNLFREILPMDCELLGMDPGKGRPETYIWRYMPAPPVCIRPSVMQDSASNEDDLTVKLTEIVWTSAIIEAGLKQGMAVASLMEQWELLQLAVAVYINSDTPQGPGQSASKPIRALTQRLKGKQGRFRGNLSGKRVDFSGRTVISPDPNLRIDQVAVPDRVAKILTYPERVTSHNIEKLRNLVITGPAQHPGANYLFKKGESLRRNLRFGDRAKIAERLEIGDVVERHLEDGDVVLFNRQPSLHRLSILAHFAQIRPWRTFRLNECVCTPYNADFDGDEMNLHVPQTEEARTEAMCLMGVKHNLVTPRSGEPIIAATQDFITGSFLISKKDYMIDRRTFCQLLAMMSDGDMQFDIPPPAIQKPVQLWTGKQVFSLLIRPNKNSKVIINLDAKNKTFQPPPKGYPRDMSPNDGFLVIRNSQVMCGAMDKATLGDGKKDSVFYSILRDYGPDEAAGAMNRMAKLCARWLGGRGFSIGISDVTPGAELSSTKEILVEQAYAKCDELIEALAQGKLEPQPGCTPAQTLEAKIGGLLSKVREEVGEVCIKELEKSNAPLIMATCGSKGSTLNVSQMVAVVGQQIISGKRVPDGFQDRSLPHFRKFSVTPPSKGFVRNSFYSGLDPPEFLFHAISGREGLVDTAVKTAETGYMSRRLMKSLEDLSARYDSTVRTSSNGVVQFRYGGDGLDPFDMEGDARPVDFNRTWTHCEYISSKLGIEKDAETVNVSSVPDTPLKPFEIMQVVEEQISKLEQKLQRMDNSGNMLSLASKAARERASAEKYVDEVDPRRDFLQSVRGFIQTKAEELATVRESRGLMGLLEKPDGDEYDGQDFDLFAPKPVIRAVNQVCRISHRMVDTFLQACLRKYQKAQVEPGTAVGAIGAQSIGEPGTQMTLKTFHFAGVASMNVTLGVPRIKEIINASKTISTPIITTVLNNETELQAARIVKGRIEKTLLGDIAHYIQDEYSYSKASVRVRIDFNTIDHLLLEIDMDQIREAIIKAPKLKLKPGQVSIEEEKYIRVDIESDAVKKNGSTTIIDQDGEIFEEGVESDTAMFLRTQHLKRVLPNVVVKGFTDISRAVINIREKDNTHELLVEGYGLRHVMTTSGVIGTQTSTNHVLEVKEVLGIEAARASIIHEIDYTMSKHGMSVDPRHITLLGDVMTYKGDVLGITRFGLAKMRDSVLQLASFEKTTDHLFDAAFYMKTDDVEGVSECIILGQGMSIGTGAFKVLQPLALDKVKIGPKPLLFEEVCKQLKNVKLED
ncbi:DNA-directed RNA polymerase III subunit RPC1 [Yarrowia sp. B02]|nr:DNA-directed RNA polymerase III subunit RPC1 [Yarrowia sp. B02]